MGPHLMCLSWARCAGGPSSLTGSREGEAYGSGSTGKGQDKPGGPHPFENFPSWFQCVEITDVSSNWMSNFSLGKKPLCLRGNQLWGRMLLCLHIWEEKSSPLAHVKMTKCYGGRFGEKPSDHGPYEQGSRSAPGTSMSVLNYEMPVPPTLAL